MLVTVNISSLHQSGEQEAEPTEAEPLGDTYKRFIKELAYTTVRTIEASLISIGQVVRKGWLKFMDPSGSCCSQRRFLLHQGSLSCSEDL